MDRRKIKATARHLRRFLSNFVVAKTLRREYLPPQVAVYHVTYDCNAKCAWCSRVHDRQEAAQNIGWQRIEQIFQSLRQVAPALYLTGGEPLLDPRIEDMLALAKSMDFYPIAVNTNALLLEERSLVPELADTLVVSLHSANPARLARIFGIKEQTAVKALVNIIRSAMVAKDFGNEVVVNCVLAPDNVQEAEGVLRFCLEHKIPLAVVPAIMDHEPLIRQAEMRERATYNSFLDRVMLFKQHEPNLIRSSLAYLRRLRYLESFDCRPTSILSVSPDGHVINPCAFKFAHLPKHIAWIDGNGSLGNLMPKLLGTKRDFAVCSMNCLKACYVEPALALEQPSQAIAEQLRYLI